MIKRLVIITLMLTVVGAAGAALLDAQPTPVSSQPNAAAEMQSAPETAVEDQPSAVFESAEITPTVPPVANAASAGQPLQLQQEQAVNQVGEVWSSSGIIMSFDVVGMYVLLDDGSQIYVELGPAAYWQAQGVTLAVGDYITINGFYNGEQYHAGVVTTVTGAQISVRDELGRPLWSGGAAGQGQQGAQAGAGQEQVAPEDWVTLTGMVAAVSNNGLTMQTSDGQTLTLQFGRADFWQTQAVTFAVGDAISALGFWQGTQFQAAQVTKTATGERIMLRDPNGRPLWGGPGRAGNSGSGNGNGNAGQQGANGSGGNGNGGQQRGSGNGGSGNGNQYGRQGG